jgi:hypothetical protein
MNTLNYFTSKMEAARSSEMLVSNHITIQHYNPQDRYFTIHRRENLKMALDYRLDDRGFESRQGLGIFLFTTASRTALGPTQPHIQWVPGALSLGVKRPGRKDDHSSPSSAESKNA